MIGGRGGAHHLPRRNGHKLDSRDFATPRCDLDGDDLDATRTLSRYFSATTCEVRRAAQARSDRVAAIETGTRIKTEEVEHATHTL